MRLGGIDVKIQPNTLAQQIYQSEKIRQRHRHRYEFNNSFKARFENAKMVFSGMNIEKNLVEIMELPSHPFYISCQFHPELISRPTKPEPLFTHFIKAASAFSDNQ
jgi:CTP synthase